MADHVAGQIVPPGPGEIVVETPDGTSFRVEADDIGLFDFAGLPRGRVRLRCETPIGAAGHRLGVPVTRLARVQVPRAMKE